MFEFCTDVWLGDPTVRSSASLSVVGDMAGSLAPQICIGETIMCESWGLFEQIFPFLGPTWATRWHPRLRLLPGFLGRSVFQI